MEHAFKDEKLLKAKLQSSYIFNFNCINFAAFRSTPNTKKMNNNYTLKSFLFITGSFLLLTIASCKKEKSAATPAVATPMKLGLYEFGSNATYNFRQLQINVSKIGTQAVSYGLVFDTGSGGMVIDAQGILPTSMITSSGFTFTGDSTVVNGITVTSQKQIVQYGDSDSSSTKVYGNLAYAPVTIGDVNGNIVIKRLPFFIYYKAVDAKGNKQSAHEFDVMGVLDQYDVTFANNAYITSPFTFFDPGTGLTKGFKIAVLGTSNFSNNGYATFVPGVLTLGLTSSDLSSSSGFVMNQLSFYQGAGYLPYLPATVTYGSKTSTTYVLFDSGTDPYNFIEDKTVSSTSLLPINTAITAATGTGFTYSYTTTSTESPTYIENPGTGGSNFAIFGMQYFLTNEYMLDYTNHKLGLKNN